jgi:hypothetical protein
MIFASEPGFAWSPPKINADRGAWWSVHERPVSIQKLAVGGDIYVGCWSP